MECDVCEQPGRRKFYCEVCLKERLLIHRSALKRLGENHEATVKKALSVLEAPGGVQERRIAKARRAKLLVDCQELDQKNQQLVGKVQRSQTLIEKKRIELTIRRNRLQEARQRLEYQRTSPQASSSHRNINPGSPLSSLSLTHLVNLRHQAVVAEQHWGEVLKNLTVVRRNLISQLVSIYPITYHKTESQEPTRISELEEPHYRKNLSESTSAIVRTEWKITGLCLPTPAEVKCTFQQ
ncbi:hypothetical protein CROQUDRAFT_35482 [Cronartium quercuum f. sp. fusiforme G11]|uniref:Autophagy-related protein 14 n=1 Tax=Cronartium quercuum f. sp. fusiforme G11 TaxID=708437 RepID=A0A9P6NZS1_9BASI|nr:hypothetical protein CROQUDRAFT_35482 [Cronartium quercuum f. sp. fusiforme G11]